jgi:hypothetical protein
MADEAVLNKVMKKLKIKNIPPCKILLPLSGNHKKSSGKVASSGAEKAML